MQALWLFLATLMTTSVWAAELEAFSPLGLSQDVRQVKSVFSAPMAPLGKSDAPAPFTVECAAGHGYWIDERTWVYDLSAGLAPASDCRFSPVADLKTLAGEPVKAALEYRFHSAAPKLSSSYPYGDSTIDENQVFLLFFDAPIKPEAVTTHAYCGIPGIFERIPVSHITGAQRQSLLNQDSLRDQWIDVPQERVELVQCSRPLPANAKIALVWNAGGPAAETNDALIQRINFEVRDHFVARLRCTRENARAGCMPLEPIRLDFSAPVARADLDRISLLDSTGKSYRQAAETSRYGLSVRFQGPFPASSTLKLSLPEGLKDDIGRALLNQGRFPLSVPVEAMPPLVKFAGSFGVLERKEGGLLPITLRNLEPAPEGTAAKVRWLRIDQDAEIAAWWQRLQDFEHPDVWPRPDRRRERLLDAKLPGLVERSLPKPYGAKEFEVVGLPLQKPGFYLIEAESHRLGRALLGAEAPMYVRASALVTNMAVHFKWGPKSSLAWVTALDTGQPVAKAAITVNDCQGKALARGVTDIRGMSFIPTGLPDPRDYAACPLMVTARAGDDLSFARSDWDEGIETWRFNLSSDWQAEDRLARSVLDRSLFKPGETVHMKHLVREKTLTGLRYPKTRPATLQIEHQASSQAWFLPLNWTQDGAETTWKIPATAKRGLYTLRLIDKAIPPDAPVSELQYLPGLDSGQFNVADFRIPLMQASLSPVKPNLIAADSAEWDVSVAYLNGGAARNLPVKLRAQLTPRYGMHFESWPDYSFAHPADGAQSDSPVVLNAEPLVLDDGGAGRTRIREIPMRQHPQSLEAELEYSDPNGEIQTVARRLTWHPASVLIGFKQPEWVKVGASTSLEFMTVDPAGKPLAHVPVSARPVLRRDLSYRVRLAGGFYGYRQESADIPLDSACTGESDDQGRFRCTINNERSGEIVLTAEARDAEGRVATTSASFWVAGQDDWWFAQENHDRIDLIPEKKTWRPGEKARFQVRMPFRAATALVTVERDGILDARLVKLTGQAPVIELPVQASWAPNIYVSALVVRGRVGEPPASALVDLGKPAFKLGLARIEVDQRDQHLNVQVKTDRDSYPTGAKAKARIKVSMANGQPLAKDTTVIVAAVDEGLLELADNPSWDLLSAMMAERAYNMRTFTAQMQVTGKRHFGRKATPAGGGGGRSPTRELFDTLLYWNPAVQLDASGEASVDIPLNDSLTRFRIVAVAAAESAFGHGWTGIRATQDLQISSGLPPIVRVGDAVNSHFTVRNSTSRTMTVALGAQAGQLGALPPQRLQLAPGEGKEIGWTIRVPADLNSLSWYVNAREMDGPARDVMRVEQTVQPAVPVRQVAGQLYRLDKPLDLPVAPPADALPGQSELRATLAASLGDGLSGVRDYMRRYPYACLEQKTSRAIALQDSKVWAELMEALPGYLDGSGLAAYFPGLPQGSVELTAYLLSISDEAGYSLPVPARLRMEQALSDYLEGRLVISPDPWLPGIADTARRLSALEALARAGKVTAAQVDTIRVTPEHWPASLLIDWIDTLKRSADLPQRDNRLKAAQNALRTRITLTGNRINLADEGLWWMMRSADGTALRGLLAVLDLPGWKTDLPRLVSGVLARQSRGHWDTSTANAWGTLALNKYGRQFDSARPAGKSTAKLNESSRVVDWKDFPNGATATFPLPDEQTTLKLRHQGAGAPYVTLATLAAVDLKQPIERGYAISHELIPIEQKLAGSWSRGDIVRVRLTVDARDDMGWVVVDDPIPAGASLLGSGLKRDSAILTGDEQQQGQVWPAWQERRFDRFQSYYPFVPRGRFSLEYTLRLNNPGSFKLPPTRVEAMYAPEMYGEAPNADWLVRP